VLNVVVDSLLLRFGNVLSFLGLTMIALIIAINDKTLISHFAAICGAESNSWDSLHYVCVLICVAYTMAWKTLADTVNKMEESIKRKFKRSDLLRTLLVVVVFVPLVVLYAWQARLTVVDPLRPYQLSSDEQVVCLVFDDGTNDQMEILPLLSQYNIHASFGIITSYVDRGFPAYFSWGQVQHLSSLGHDVISHSFSHPHFNTLSLETIRYELRTSKSMLFDHGIDTKIFSYPYGEGGENETVRSEVASVYALARGIGNLQVDLTDFDRYNLPAYSILNSTTFEQFQSYVDRAQDSSVTILYYHKFDDFPEDDYTVTFSMFERQLHYLSEHKFIIKTLSELFFGGD